MCITNRQQDQLLSMADKLNKIRQQIDRMESEFRCECGSDECEICIGLALLTLGADQMAEVCRAGCPQVA